MQRATWNARTNLGSMYTVARTTGAQAAWRSTDLLGRNVTGQGVTVALIDTGISPVAGLDAAGKVINGLDLSSAGGATRFLDDVGHGTYIAGIIAGRDLPATAAATGRSTAFAGIAPDARLLNVKIAGADDAVAVGQVIAAIDWVVEHRNDDGMNVRVLNISSGAASFQPVAVDPLATAVEKAWAAGIVVVASAGNDGGSAQLTMPAADPYVIAVGAADNQGTAQIADDLLGTFTNPGTAERRPDLVAPGKSVVSLRVPGSVIDQDSPQGLVPGDRSGRFFRGTGTSQAAAVVSGAAALLLQARPELTPDQVKYLLTESADLLPAEPSAAQGAGTVNIEAALALATPTTADSLQSFPAAAGDGATSGTSAVAGWHWAGWHWAGWHWAGWHWAGWHWAGWHWAGWHWA